VKSLIAPAAILALGLAVAGFFVGGRYSFAPIRGNEIARLDRFTGEVSMCVLGTGGDGCGYVMEPPTAARDSDKDQRASSKPGGIGGS
jgi:hypothetical protein